MYLVPSVIYLTESPDSEQGLGWVDFFLFLLLPLFFFLFSSFFFFLLNMVFIFENSGEQHPKRKGCEEDSSLEGTEPTLPIVLLFGSHESSPWEPEERNVSVRE